MRFLFVLDSVENPAAANPRLGRRLAAQVAARGHEVHLLELWDGETPPPAEKDTIPHLLPFADERRMNRALENGARQGSPLPLRLARLASHPTAVAAAFRQLVLHRPRRMTACKKALRQLDAEFGFDVILAVAAPYRAAFALQELETKARKVLWQMDPYGGNRDYRAPGGYARESALLAQLDRIFVTPQAMQDYAPGQPLAAHRDRARLLGFPCLLPMTAFPKETPGLRCVFCGTLYPGLREPCFALELFSALARAGSSWQLVMAGGGWQHFAAEAERAEAAMEGRLQIPGPVPPQKAAEMQQSADLLLSLGNAVDNQMPSKLFEYFGYGKPILHLAATLADPTLPYLERYPLALVLQAGEGVTPAVVERLRRWLDATVGKTLPYDQVAALYPQFTPAGVAEDFLRELP